MTVKELKELLSEYPDEMLVLVNAGKEGWCYDIDMFAIKANCEDGEILAQEDDEDFDEENCVLLLDATR